MADKKPIPIPLKRRWRDFRVVYLPYLTFGLIGAAILWMWSQYVEPSRVLGEVDTLRARVASTVPGTLEAVLVERFQRVTNGQHVATLRRMNPVEREAESRAIEADLKLVAARLEAEQNGAEEDHARLRVQALSERLNLNLARIMLEQAEREYERMKRLYDDKIVSNGMPLTPGNEGARFDYGFDVAARDRDAYRAEVKDRESIVAGLESEVKALGTTAGTEALVEEAIEAQRQRLKAATEAITLLSPIDGQVSMVNFSAGENVLAGEPILTISGENADRIVAWVRQPITELPTERGLVEVRVEGGLGGQSAEARILKVGTQLEPISETLLGPSVNPNRVEVGLPFLVEAPHTLNLLPGQTVQIVLK